MVARAQLLALGFDRDAIANRRNLVAELDGYDFHHTKQAFERDRDRDVDLLDAGFSTIRITHTRLTRHATKKAKRLRFLLGQRSRLVKERG